MKQLYTVIYTHQAENNNHNIISQTQLNIEKALLHANKNYVSGKKVRTRIHIVGLENYHKAPKSNWDEILEYILKRLKQPISPRNFEPEISFTRVFTNKISEQTRAFIKRARTENIHFLRISCSNCTKWYVFLLWKYLAKDIKISFI